MSSDGTDPVPLAERIAPPFHVTASPRDHEPDAADIEKLRKWQEARIERKLRGEYESALLRLSDLIKESKDTPMRITSVRVDGAEKTRPSFIHWLIEPHLASSKSDTSTLNDVLQASQRITNSLLQSDIFSAVLPRLEGSSDVLAQPGDVDLVLKTRPRGKYFLKTATEIGDQEGSVSLQARVRNAFGGAETLDAVLSSGLRTRLAGHVAFSTPLFTPSLRTRGELSVFGLEKDLTAYASCIEGTRGVRAAIKNVNRRTTSEFAYEAALRHLHALTESASLSIRETAGHSVKSALSHTWTYESRDDRAVPTRGGYFRSYNELAGLGGDTAFFKSHLSCQLARRLFPSSSSSSTSISLSARAGCLYPLLGSSPPRFNDRFQLGGPLDVRMFKQSGLGPRDGDDALGGDLFWAAGVSVISDLPGKRMKEWPVKMHAFANAGRLVMLDNDRPLMENVRSLISRPCISAGVGLLYRLDPVRVELNFGVPLVANKTDAPRKGFQIGIGIDFL